MKKRLLGRRKNEAQKCECAAKKLQSHMFKSCIWRTLKKNQGQLPTKLIFANKILLFTNK